MFKIIKFIVKTIIFAVELLAYPVAFIVGMTFKENDTFRKTLKATNELYLYLWNPTLLDQ